MDTRTRKLLSTAEQLASLETDDTNTLKAVRACEIAGTWAFFEVEDVVAWISSMRKHAPMHVDGIRYIYSQNGYTRDWNQKL